MSCRDDGTDHGDTCVTTNAVAADLGQPAAVSQGSGMQHRQKMFTQKEINTIVTFCRDIQGQMTKENLTSALSGSNDTNQLLKVNTTQCVIAAGTPRLLWYNF